MPESFHLDVDWFRVILGVHPQSMLIILDKYLFYDLFSSLSSNVDALDPTWGASRRTACFTMLVGYRLFYPVFDWNPSNISLISAFNLGNILIRWLYVPPSYIGEALSTLGFTTDVTWPGFDCRHGCLPWHAKHTDGWSCWMLVQFIHSKAQFIDKRRQVMQWTATNQPQ